MQVTHMVGQQQNELGIDQGTLLVSQIAVGIDQGFVKIVTRCEVTKVTFACLGSWGVGSCCDLSISNSHGGLLQCGLHLLRIELTPTCAHMLIGAHQPCAARFGIVAFGK